MYQLLPAAFLPAQQKEPLEDFYRVLDVPAKADSFPSTSGGEPYTLQKNAKKRYLLIMSELIYPEFFARLNNKQDSVPSHQQVLCAGVNTSAEKFQCKICMFLQIFLTVFPLESNLYKNPSKNAAVYLQYYFLSKSIVLLKGRFLKNAGVFISFGSIFCETAGFTGLKPATYVFKPDSLSCS